MNKTISILQRICRAFFRPKIIVITFWLCVFVAGLYFFRLFDLFTRRDTVLHLFTFANVVDPKLLVRFEKESGIAVRTSFIETNEELFAKFQVSKGRGYDVIIVSDYMIELLRQQNLLHKLDMSKIRAFNELDERLLNRFFDPKNQYSVPFEWTVYGLCLQSTFFGTRLQKPGWDLLFEDPVRFDKYSYKIGMTNDSREAVFFAALYLFGKTTQLTKDELEVVKRLLMRQKQWVEAYEIERMEYFLASGIVPVAVSPASYLFRMLDFEHGYRFIVPKKGSLIDIENIAVPRATKKIDLVYKFINFLLSAEVSAYNTERFQFNPANKKTYALLPKKLLNYLLPFTKDELFSKLHTLRNEISPRVYEALWLAVKTS